MFPSIWKEFGLNIIIYNQSYYPFDLKTFERIAVETSLETDIMLKRNFFDKLQQPYSDCGLDIRTADRNSIDSDAWRIIYDNKYLYKESYCSQLNYGTTVGRICNCTNRVDKYPNLELCVSQECPSKIYRNIREDKNYYGNIEKLCPTECNFNWFDSFVTSIKFPVKTYATHLRNNYQVYQNFSQGMVITDQDVIRSTARVRLFYDRIGFFSTDEVENMLFIDLISNIGGTISLFLGASLVSFFEIFQIFASLSYLIFNFDSEKLNLKMFDEDVQKTRNETSFKKLNIMHKRSGSF